MPLSSRTVASEIARASENRPTRLREQPMKALAQVGQCQLELVEAVSELRFTDHQWRSQPNGGTMSVLGQHMSPCQRLTNITPGTKAGINVNTGPQAAR